MNELYSEEYVELTVSVSTFEGKGRTPAHIYLNCDISKAIDVITSLYSAIDYTVYGKDSVKDVALKHQFSDVYAIVVTVDTLVYADEVWSSIVGLCRFAAKNPLVGESEVSDFCYGY